jgi:hypothetical protein
VDEASSGGDQQDQRKLGRLRAGVILRAHIQGWPAIDLGSVSVAAGPESWASFLEVAASDDLAMVLAALNDAAEHLHGFSERDVHGCDTPCAGRTAATKGPPGCSPGPLLVEAAEQTVEDSRPGQQSQHRPP